MSSMQGILKLSCYPSLNFFYFLIHSFSDSKCSEHYSHYCEWNFEEVIVPPIPLNRKKPKLNRHILPYLSNQLQWMFEQGAVRAPGSTLSSPFCVGGQTGIGVSICQQRHGYSPQVFMLLLKVGGPRKGLLGFSFSK